MRCVREEASSRLGEAARSPRPAVHRAKELFLDQGGPAGFCLWKTIKPQFRRHPPPVLHTFISLP